MRIAVVMLVASLALTGPARAEEVKDVASPSCREGFACPGRAGFVDVTLAGFDGSGALGNEPGTLDSDEIQCALDCLDGNPDPDHVLAGPAKPSTPTPVPGGTIRFDPSVTYAIQRGLRLPASTQGAMTIDGNGARLKIATRGRDKAPIAVLARIAPPGANNCDLEVMSTWAQMWTIENLTIHGDGSDTDEGIVLHGTNSPTIRNCTLGALGVGVDMRFSGLPLVERCMFVNDRRHDVFLGTGDSEPGPAARGFERCATGPKVFTAAGSSTRQLVEGGCNGATIRNCRFLMHPQQLSSVRVRASRSVVIEGAGFDGYRGRHAIHHSHYLADELTVRDMYFETNIGSPDAVIKFDGGTRLLVEGLHLVSGEQLVAIDASENTGCYVTLRHVPWVPQNVTFRNGPNVWRNEWRFEDVTANDLPLPVRWTGGPPPRTLTIDRIGVEIRPGVEAVRTLRIPVGSPVEQGGKLEQGHVWIDRKTGKLMYCCDEHGRPRPAS